MRILVIGSLPSSLLNFRGPLLKTLVSRGHKVIACAPDAPSNIRAELDKIGVIYRNIPLSRAGLSPWADMRTLIALCRLIRREKPDRVLAYTVKPVIYSCLAAIPTKTNVYAMIEGLGYAFGDASWRQQLVGWMVQNLYRQALKYCTGVFFLNPDDLALFKSQNLIPEKILPKIVNGTGVDMDWYFSCPLPDAPVFLLIARLLVDKGLREYYQAAQTLKARYPQARFLLAGDLDSNPMSIRASELEQWQSGGVIEYLGFLDDVRPAYAAARVYVLPSFYREGLPRTLLEAMAMGRPIITTDAPGCRETVVDGENGFLVPVRNVEALTVAMERFILEPELANRMGQASLQLVREKYDVHQVNEVIMRAMGISQTIG